MDLELRDRVAVVTGASAGIGRAVAEVLAAEGVQLAVVARRAERLERLADEIAASGAPRPLVVPVDLGTPDAHTLVRDRVLGAFGRADILVNSAGGSRPLPVDATEEQWTEAFAVNFVALRRLTHALLPSMRQRRWGRIINITGSSEPRGMNAANAAKAAVHAWAKGLSREVGPYGITVNSIPPGRIMSEQIVERLHPTPEDREAFAKANIPLGYFGEPHDVAYLVAFLASPRGRYITGEVIHVDGGMRRFAF
ncbi:MAG TPA: SDR family oxidoreductase [Thermodesulfobacteriota bacterium]